MLYCSQTFIDNFFSWCVYHRRNIIYGAVTMVTIIRPLRALFFIDIIHYDIIHHDITIAGDYFISLSTPPLFPTLSCPPLPPISNPTCITMCGAVDIYYVVYTVVILCTCMRTRIQTNKHAYTHAYIHT